MKYALLFLSLISGINLSASVRIIIEGIYNNRSHPVIFYDVYLFSIGQIEPGQVYTKQFNARHIGFSEIVNEKRVSLALFQAMVDYERKGVRVTLNLSGPPLEPNVIFDTYSQLFQHVNSLEDLDIFVTIYLSEQLDDSIMRLRTQLKSKR